MSLMICPDCKHEVSTTAVACANCGRPTHDPTIERNVVIAEMPAPVRDDFPKWIFIPLAVLGALLLIFLFAWMRNKDDTSNLNVNVNLASKRSTSAANDTTRETTTTTRTEAPNQVTIPPSDSTTVTTAPSTSSSSQTTQPSSVTNVPGESVATTNTDRGTVVVDAKISSRTGGIQPVKNEKFYLLDKDLEEILDDANIEDETGQGLKNAFGLSVLYPDRYGDVRTKALSAIGRHTKYSALTDGSGKAQIKDIKPDTYYLFGITKTRTGFAIWSSQVPITAGQNVLNLSPASITEAQ